MNLSRIAAGVTLALAATALLPTVANASPQSCSFTFALPSSITTTDQLVIGIGVEDVCQAADPADGVFYEFALRNSDTNLDVQTFEETTYHTNTSISFANTFPAGHYTVVYSATETPGGVLPWVFSGDVTITKPAATVPAPSSTPAPKPPKGKSSALTLLNKLPVKTESHASSYSRSKFKTWVDANRDGENTRAEVLKTESTKKVTESAHVVRSGRWVSHYDSPAKTFSSASSLDIDHLVPLQEAWTSGASSWSTQKRTAFANDIGYPASLIAVSAHANRSKGDREPNNYLPPNRAYRCTYVRNYIAVKYRWNLQVNPGEKAALKADLSTYCSVTWVTTPSAPNLTALAGKTVKPKPPVHRGTDTRYATCTELERHANHAPYYRGKDVEYPWYQDRDHDGIVCE